MLADKREPRHESTSRRHLSRCHGACKSTDLSGRRATYLNPCHPERARGSAATKGESKDPENVSFRTLLQGALTRVYTVQLKESSYHHAGFSRAVNALGI